MGVFKGSLITELMKFGNFDVNSKAIDDLLFRCEGTAYTDATLPKLFEGQIIYLRNSYNNISECSVDDATIKLVPVNIAGNGKDLFVAFYKSNKSWEGLKFGTRDTLVTVGSKRSDMRYCGAAFLETLYDMLLVKEKWFIMQNGKRDFLRMKSYLSGLCALSKKFVDNPQEHCVITNADSNKVMFDTNLLNVYGNRIILCHDIKIFADSRKNPMIRYVNPSIVGNVKDAEDNGFTADDYISLKPFPLYKDASELVFTGKFEDFDLEDIHHLNHIKFHREFRLPVFMREMDQVSLFYLIKNAIELAVKQNNVNFKYIVPSYSLSDLKPWFLIPVFKMGGPSRPACALLINNKNGRWTVYTVLEMEQAYLSARTIAPPTGWLDI